MCPEEHSITLRVRTKSSPSHAESAVAAPRHDRRITTQRRDQDNTRAGHDVRSERRDAVARTRPTGGAVAAVRHPPCTCRHVCTRTPQHMRALCAHGAPPPPLHHGAIERRPTGHMESGWPGRREAARSARCSAEAHRAAEPPPDPVRRLCPKGTRAPRPARRHGLRASSRPRPDRQSAACVALRLVGWL